MGSRQFVTFRVGDHLVGLDVRSVREINRLLDITPVPRAPAFVCGLVNLRGQTVTLFDLGVRLGLGPRALTEASHNVILKAAAVGCLVDAIGDVVQAEVEQVEPVPANTEGIDTELLEGVVQLPEELLLVLSASRLLSPGRPAASGSPRPGMDA